mgnify:CR=1 FL=1
MSAVTSSADDPDDIETVSVGWFRYRERSGAPWQALRIIRESGRWVAILSGKVVPGSGAERAKDIPFLLYRSPFHQISETEYLALLRAYENAPPGHPLRTPSQPVDMRAAPGLYRGKTP